MRSISWRTRIGPPGHERSVSVVLMTSTTGSARVKARRYASRARSGRFRQSQAPSSRTTAQSSGSSSGGSTGGTPMTAWGSTWIGLSNTRSYAARFHSVGTQISSTSAISWWNRNGRSSSSQTEWPIRNSARNPSITCFQANGTECSTRISPSTSRRRIARIHAGASPDSFVRIGPAARWCSGSHAMSTPTACSERIVRRAAMPMPDVTHSDAYRTRPVMAPNLPERPTRMQRRR